MPDDGLAEDIAEELLYRTGRAMKEGNFDAFFECFEIPQIMETLDGAKLVTTRDGMRDIFLQVYRYYQANGVVDLVRTVVSARFLDEETIGSTHVSSLLKANGEPFRNPYPVYSVVKRIGGQWKVVSNSSAILDAPDHNRALLGGEDGKALPTGDQKKP